MGRTYKSECTLKVSGFTLVEEEHVETIDDLDKLTVDVLQGLVVGLEGIHQLWLCIHHLLRQHDGADPLQSVSPLRNVRAVVGSAQEQDAECRDEDRPQVLCLVASDLGAMD